MALSERKRRVLEVLIESYIETASPVGSRTLARKHKLGFSSATIRNEMADLEEMGFLEQPHTSAGRIPSDKGYRLYVDSLMHVRQLALDEIGKIDHCFRQRTQEFEYLISLTARVLSDMTSCMALVDGPQAAELHCRTVQLLPLDQSRALMVIIVEGGLVEHCVLEGLPEGTTREELDYVSSILNQHLTGSSLQAMQSSIIRALRSELDRYRKMATAVLDMLVDTVRQSEEKLVFGGTAQIMSQPEFQDVGRVKSVLQAVECAQIVRKLMSGATTRGTPMVMIGEEIWVKEIQECSLVIAPYYIGGSLGGRIAVLGPRRMEYGRIVAIVSRVSEALSSSLDADKSED